MAKDKIVERTEGDDILDALSLRINSTLNMDIKKDQIVENDEWLDMVEFTIPYIEKALIKQ